ncbi:MAG TPA: hypothetical protein VGA61_14530 [Anaerolineae bacterium]
MSQQWRRFLPESKHLILAAVVAVLVLIGVGFASLYQLKGEALAERAAAAAQVEQLQAQKGQLVDELDKAQRGENVEPQARDLFKVARPGDKVIIAVPATPVGAQSPSSLPTSAGNDSANPPYWREWLERLLGQ